MIPYICTHIKSHCNEHLKHNSMTLCKYCHKEMTKDNLHEECEKKHKESIIKLEKLFFDFLSGLTSYDEIKEQQFKITHEGYLSDADVKDCTLLALKQFTESIKWPYYHIYENKAKQLVDALRHEPAYLFDTTELDNALKKLSEKLVEGYYNSYFSDNASEFQVMKNVHKVTQVLPLDVNKEKEICKEVLDGANEQKERRAFTYAHYFIDDEGANPFSIPQEFLDTFSL